MGTTKSDSKKPKPKQGSMVVPESSNSLAPSQRRRKWPRSQHHVLGPDLVAVVVETLPRLAENRTLRCSVQFHVLSQRSWRHSVHSAAWRLPLVLSARRLRLSFHYAASDERPIGSGTVRVRSSESPTSRPCRVTGGKVVCGAQDAEPTGGDHLPGCEVQGRKTCVGHGRSMDPTRYERFFAFLKKGVWRSCAAVGLKRERPYSDRRKYVMITRSYEPERWIFRKATLYDFLKRPGILVYPAFAIEGWCCPLHAVNRWNQIVIDNVGNMLPDPMEGGRRFRDAG